MMLVMFWVTPRGLFLGFIAGGGFALRACSGVQAWWGGFQVVWADGGVSPVLGFYLGVLVLFRSWSGSSSPGDCFRWTCGVSSSPALTEEVMLQVWVLWVSNELTSFGCRWRHGRFSEVSV